jgi:cell division protein ZapD
MITFEYPLNEKNRSYLRFEFLFIQIQKSMMFAHESDSIAFFKAFFELLELSERSDIRHDLIKDLRQLSQLMESWLAHEQVNHSAVRELIGEIEQLNNALLTMPKQLNFFKKDRFLNSVKQRFFIPSGCCNFDLPQFHFWLARDLEMRQHDSRKWFSHFASFEKALALFLKMKRSQGISRERIAKSGFYQGEAENSGFIRVKVKKDKAVYPLVSGHKNRFSVRFINADEQVNCSSDIPFQEVVC